MAPLGPLPLLVGGGAPGREPRRRMAPWALGRRAAMRGAGRHGPALPGQPFAPPRCRAVEEHAGSAVSGRAPGVAGTAGRLGACAVPRSVTCFRGCAQARKVKKVLENVYEFAFDVLIVQKVLLKAHKMVSSDFPCELIVNFRMFSHT